MPLILVLLACTPDGPLSRPDPLGPDALHDATFALTSIGARQIATPQEVEAQAWMERALVDAGLTDVVSEPFVVDAWRPGTASVQMDREVPVEALSPSGDTDVTLVLRDESEDFAGAAVLISSEGSTRAEALLTALGGGALAMIRVTEALDFDGSLLVEVGHLLDGVSLPSVAVDHGTALWLRSRIGQDVTIQIAPDIASDHTSYNVVGRVPAHGSDPGRVYVVAHYDSWHPSESAFDNALGAAGLVQLAVAVADAAPSREIVFLATSAEEQGLKGALAWVDDHVDEISSADDVLVLDVLWSGEGAYVAMGTDPSLITAAIDAAAAEDLDAVDGGDPGFGSDHVPFVTRGARATWLGRWPDRHYHTVADTIDGLDFDEASRALRTNYALLVDAAGISP